MCDAPDFVVNQRGQFIERSFVSLPPFDQQTRQVVSRKRGHRGRF
jgi:hypothetical protein